MPPLQFSRKLVPPTEMVEKIGGGASTLMFRVAVLERFCGSFTLTTKLLPPRFAESGSPERVPSVPTINQAGPLTLANVSVSPGMGSVTLVAMVPE